MSGADVNAAVEPVDRAHMLLSETELLRENPSWLAVLQAYVEALEALANADAQPETDSDPSTDIGSTTDAGDIASEPAEMTGGPEDSDAELEGDADSDEPAAPQKSRRSQPWAPRLTSVEDVDSEELSKIHGRLIAYGLLKCDLADRSAGVVYQLTPEARRAIASLAAVDSDENSLEEDGQEISRSA